MDYTAIIRRNHERSIVESKARLRQPDISNSMRVTLERLIRESEARLAQLA